MTRNTLIGEGVKFQSICRVTGYLSDYSRINDAKQEEIRQRTDNSTVSAASAKSKAA